MAPASDRTWPVPGHKHFLRMGWHDLLFAHWSFDPAEVDRLLPAGVQADRFEERAWLAVVPFRMTDVAPRGIPAIPGMSSFPELNVRTYVTLEGKPGVWFFSLDAANPIAVRAARWFFHLPYMDAKMDLQRQQDAYIYQSQRTHRGEPAAEFRGRYRPLGEPFRAAVGSLEYWLTARYCLYTRDPQGRTLRGEIDHPPWPLQRAELEISKNTMFDGLQIQPHGEPHLLFAKDIQVQAWWNMRVGGGD